MLSFLSKILFIILKMHFADNIIEKIKGGKSPICIGLDPYFNNLPAYIVERNFEKFGKNSTAVAESIIEFNKGIIESIKEVALAIKPQFAFYEIWGHEGIRALEETCRYAKENSDLIVIGDGKRNDIGSTATAYAQAYLENEIEEISTNFYHCDSLTVTPYLGSDGIRPFVKSCIENEKGIFILVKTSNPSSGEFQDLITNEELVHEKVAIAVANWGADDIGESGFSSVGAVVGATYPEEIKILRNYMPSQIFLIPGYGTQGGTIADIQPAFYQGKTGAIVNSSRGIIFAYQNSKKFSPQNYQEAAYEAVKAMQKDLEILN